MPKAKRIDHVSIAVPSIDEAVTFFETVFDVQRDRVKRFESNDFYGAIFRVGESKFELLAPKSEDSFVGRFLATRGAGVHHVTVQIEDLAAMRARLEEAKIPTFGHATGEGIDETFIHPKYAYGVLFQILEQVWEDVPEPA
jgi:methylmalonyl-CoA/ethylmalonyl-CoA epimerase